eukprot:643255_1
MSFLSPKSDDDSFDDVELTHMALEIMKDLSMKQHVDPDDSYIYKLAFDEHVHLEEDIHLNTEIISHPSSLTLSTASSSTSTDNGTFIAHPTLSAYSTFNQSVDSSKNDHPSGDVPSLCPRRYSNISSVARHSLSRKATFSLIPDFSKSCEPPSKSRGKTYSKSPQLKPKRKKQHKHRSRKKTDPYLMRRSKTVNHPPPIHHARIHREHKPPPVHRVTRRKTISHHKPPPVHRACITSMHNTYAKKKATTRLRRATTDAALFKSTNKKQIQSRTRERKHSVTSCSKCHPNPSPKEYAIETENGFIFINMDTYY